MNSKEKAQELLKLADVEINGSRPWDIQVHDERLYDRIFSEGALGAGEAYMDGWWDVPELDIFFDKILSAHLNEEIKKDVKSLSFWFFVLKARLFNQQSKKRAYQVGEEHYDVGNDLYKVMLDKRLVYTCAYWKDATTLDEAQEAKLDLVCQKIGLKKGDRVLDLGGGWASFAKYAAEKYGAHVVVYTISKEQAKLGKELTKGLPVDVLLEDYRNATGGPYDHVVSIGLLEHVGWKNYRTLLKTVHRLLKDDGLFLLHSIGSNETVYVSDHWFNKYIFPNGTLPSIAQLGKAFEGLFVMEDWHNFGADYDKTLMEWFKNFDNAWPTLKAHYSDRFYRMWKYYLLVMAGAFRSRQNNQLWQIVLSKKGVRGGYMSVR